MGREAHEAFVCFQERSVLPKNYTKVPTVARSSTINSGISLDCSSSTTLATTVSPFNSQTALIVEKKSSSPGSVAATPVSHYYEQNLRNNHQQALHGSRIYNPLEKDHEHDYKQLDPLLAGEQPPYTVVPSKVSAMSSQDLKSPKESIGMEKMQETAYHFQREKKQKHFATQVISRFSTVSAIITAISEYLRGTERCRVADGRSGRVAIAGSGEEDRGSSRRDFSTTFYRARARDYVLAGKRRWPGAFLLAYEPQGYALRRISLDPFVGSPRLVRFELDARRMARPARNGRGREIFPILPLENAGIAASGVSGRTIRPERAVSACANADKS